MRKKLLITTALVALVSASNAWAERVIISQEDLNNEIWGGEKEYSVFPHNFKESKMNNDDILINNVRVSIINQDYEIKDGQKLEMQQGRFDVLGKGNGSTHSFQMSGGEVVLNGTDNIMDDKGIFGTGIKISGGSIILNNSGLTDDGTDKVNQDGRKYPASSIDISGGTIVMNSTGTGSSWLDSHGHIEYKKDENGNFIYVDEEGNRVTDEQYKEAINKGEAIATDPIKIEGSREGGEINLSGTGKIIVNGGAAKITENFQGINVWDAKDINIKDGGTLEITSGSNLVTVITPEIMEKSTINLTGTGTINLSGGLLANVEGDGKLNVKSSSALVDGNVSGSNLTFEADHSLSKAVSGTIGELASLNVNKGTLTYDAPTGKITNLNVAGGLDIGTNTVKATNVSFKDNSTLKFTVAGKEDGSYGKIQASTIDVSTTGTKLDLTLNSSVLSKGEAKDFTILDGSVSGDFAELSKNSRYEFEKLGNGQYKITGKASAADIATEAGGSANNVGTATAWDGVSLDNPSGSTSGQVANALAELAGKPDAASQKAYVDALTAVAPEVAPMVQHTQTETANQVFGAVGTRLSGGSISTGGEGMSSGDNVFERAAMWVQGLFNKSKLDDTSKAYGFDADSNGIAMGAEKYVTEDTKVGLGYAYTNTDIDGFMRSTDVDTHTAFVYGEYKPSNWYVNGIASYGWSDYDESKNVAGINVKSDYDAETFGLQAMTGYDMQMKYFGLTPEVGLRYVHISQDGYKDSADQRVSSSDSDILTGVIGAKVSKTWTLENGMNIKPEARIAATYDLMNDDTNSVVTLANGSAYMVEGDALDRFGMEFGAGLTAEVNDNVELSLGYEGKFREDYQDHTGLLNAKYKF